MQGETPVDGEKEESQGDQAELQNVNFYTCVHGDQVVKPIFTRPLKFARFVTFCDSVTRLAAVTMTTLLFSKTSSANSAAHF